MKLIEIYSKETINYSVNINHIVYIIDAKYSKDNATEVHLANGKILRIDETAKEFKNRLFGI